MANSKRRSEKNKSNRKSTDKSVDAPGAVVSDGIQAPEKQKMDAETLKKISEVRARFHETFGKIALSMTNLPRYRHLSIMDLTLVLLNPLLRDRVAVASQKSSKDMVENIDTSFGIAIWASVSEEVDKKIREQIAASVFPINMKAEDWNSGDINWLMDVIAPNQKLTTAVIASFRHVVGDSDVKIHPLVTRMIAPEALKKMGATPLNTDTNAVKKNQKKQIKMTTVNG